MDLPWHESHIHVNSLTLGSQDMHQCVLSQLYWDESKIHGNKWESSFAHLIKSRMIDCRWPSTTQWTVMPMNAITCGAVQPSRQIWSFPGYAYQFVELATEDTVVNKYTWRISETLTRLIRKISFTSRETVERDGTSTLLLRSIKISINSSSSTMAKGRWRRETHSASFRRNFG